MKTIKPIITILSISLLALVLTACQPTAIEEKPSADDSNIFPKEQAACIYKDGSCCRGEEQEICQIAQVDCEEGKEPVIKGCDEKCEAVVECVVSGESEANTSADDISDSDEVPPAPACQNLCGNSVCEEIVCLAVGCPCAETAESCSQDCIENDEIVDPTANWQIYSNDKYGYEIKYPAVYTNATTSEQKKLLTIGSGVMPYYSVEIIENISTLDDLKSLMQESVKTIAPAGLSITWKDMQVANQQAIKMSFENFAGGYTGTVYRTGLINNSNAYIIKFFNGSPEEYHQIVSTFQFKN